MLGWVACACTILALWLLGKQKITGWYFNLAGSILWLIYAIVSMQWALAVVNIVIFIMNCIGAYKWKKAAK